MSQVFPVRYFNCRFNPKLPSFNNCFQTLKNLNMSHKYLNISVITVWWLHLVFCSTVSKNFQENDIVPDVLDIEPDSFLTVNFDVVIANLGNILTPTQVKSIPKVSWIEANASSYYTLIMVDMDAPSRNDNYEKEWQHWLVVNIPGNEVEMGETLSEFISSAPPPNTGLHRYLFLWFLQPTKGDFSSFPHLKASSAKGREKFSTRKFVRAFKLVIMAGNYYQVNISFSNKKSFFLNTDLYLFRLVLMHMWIKF